jgi:glycosyltransferase involved in cell wall biosynthesis
MAIKIMYLTTSPQMGGAEKQLFELSRRLDKSEFEVLVCTLKSEGGELLQKLQKEGIKTKTIELNERKDIKRVIELYKIIKEFKPDILQSFLFFDNILARIFGRILRVPVIISGQRNVETNRSLARNFFDRLTILLAHYVISNTEAGKRIIINREKFNASKIFVVPNGIDLKNVVSLREDQKKEVRDYYGITDKHIVIGFVGYLTEQKGVGNLLKAVSLIKDEWKDRIKFLIVGGGAEEDKLKKMIKDLRIEDKVHFFGFQKNGSKFISMFDIFVLPSLWEGQPNVLLEAMAYGASIISTKVGGVEEMVENRRNGILVDAGSAYQIAGSINMLCNDSHLRKNLSKKGLEVVQRYDVNKMVSNFEKLYKQFMKDYRK